MKLGQYLPSWVSKASAPGGAANRSDATGEIRPVVFEYRHLLEVEDLEEQNSRDSQVLDKMENYFYRALEDRQVLQLLFEKMPKQKLIDLGLDYFAERESGLQELHRAICNKLTKKTVDNYDKFCVGVRAVADIKDIVMKQSDQFAEAKAKHLAVKSFYVLQVQQMIKKRAVFGRKKATLDLLEGVQQKLGRFVAAVKKSQACLEQLAAEPLTEEAKSKTKELLTELKDFEAGEKKIKQDFETLHPKLLHLLSKLALLVGRGSVS